MSNAESLRKLPEILDEVHLKTAIKKIGRWGLEVASWAEVDASGRLDLDADTVVFAHEQSPIGELFGRPQRLNMSFTNRGSLDASPQDRKFDRRIVTWDGEDITNQNDKVHIFVTKDEVVALEGHLFRFVAQEEGFEDEDMKGELVVEAAKRRFARYGDTAIQVVSGEMAERINKLIVSAPDFQ